MRATGFLQTLGELHYCMPWSLDQLERFLWVMAARRQFERFTLLGAWPTTAHTFVCVLDHPSTAPIGITVGQHGGEATHPRHPDTRPDPIRAAAIDDQVWRAVDRIVTIDTQQVSQWRKNGWSKDGIAWDRDPNDLVTPWSGYRPPRPGDVHVPPEELPWWTVKAPSTDPDPWDAAVEDLRNWSEQPMWASTMLLRRVVIAGAQTRTEGRRWVAGWAVASHWMAHVEAYVWPKDGTGQGAQLRGMPRIPEEAALPGQRYLRRGEMSLAGPGNWSVNLHARYSEDAYNTRLPLSILRGGLPSRGILWGNRFAGRPRGNPQHVVLSTHPSADRMASVLHHAIDRSNPAAC